MSRNQRLTFLGIAALIAVVAVVIFVTSGGDDEQEATGTAATTTATATPSATEQASGTSTPTPTPEPQPPLLQAGKVAKLRYSEGDTVQFRVRSDQPEEVHVHGYDIKKDLEAGQTATMSFKATITGIFEVEFEQSGEQIAELRVDPK